MPGLQLRKLAKPLSTGIGLLDMILGLDQEEPDVMSLVNPMAFGGVLSKSLYKYQGSGASNWIEELIAHPNFGKFQQKIQKEVEKVLGPLFKVYRGIGPRELESLGQTGYLGARPTPFTIDPEIARGFAYTHKMQPTMDIWGKEIAPGWGPKMLEALATPESVIARPTWSTRMGSGFGREKELLLNPKSLINYLVYDAPLPGKAWQEYIGNLAKESSKTVDPYWGFIDK